MITNEQSQTGVKTVSSEIGKTASQSTDLKTQPFPSEASLLGHHQAKCKRNNFILLTSLEKYTSF